MNYLLCGVGDGEVNSLADFSLKAFVSTVLDACRVMIYARSLDHAHGEFYPGSILIGGNYREVFIAVGWESIRDYEPEEDRPMLSRATGVVLYRSPSVEDPSAYRPVATVRTTQWGWSIAPPPASARWRGRSCPPGFERAIKPEDHVFSPTPSDSTPSPVKDRVRTAVEPTTRIVG